MAFETTVRALMDLGDIMLSGTSQTETDKSCMISLICGIRKQIKKHNGTGRTIQTKKNKWL